MRQRPVLIVVSLVVAAGVAATVWAFARTTYDEHAANCTTALTKPTGSNASDTPTVSEAEERMDALDDTLAGMVRSGYDGVAKDAFDTLEKKTKESESRPEACEPLSGDDYTALLTAKTIDGLGWTGEGGEFDKLKMVESLGD
jgi:hypothetical protein